MNNGEAIILFYFAYIVVQRREMHSCISRKHKALKRNWVDIGPSYTTLGQHNKFKMFFFTRNDYIIGVLHVRSHQVTLNIDLKLFSTIMTSHLGALRPSQ